MAAPTAPPSDLLPFLDTDPVRQSGVFALAAAVALTDDLATYLLELVGVPDPARLTRALQICDFVVEREHEWQISSRVRAYLTARLAEQPDLLRKAHQPLLLLAQSERLDRDFAAIPRYLTAGAGHPYHSAVFDQETGLREYSQLGQVGRRNVKWLGAQLAREQQELGILPAGAIEIVFLRGMALYADYRRAEAEPLLRQVARDGSTRPEVGIALHIVGRIDSQRRRYSQAERELRDSRRILDELGDLDGQAKVLLTLGQMLMKPDVSRGREAEALLRASLTIEQSQHNLSGEAMVLHTLGQLVGRDSNRVIEAKRMLRRSLEIEEQRGNGPGIAQVAHTLGHRLARERGREAALEAELLLERSLKLRRQQRDQISEAQVLHTLGELIGHDKNRVSEAEDLLRRSLRLRQEQQDPSSEAQVLHTLGRLIARAPKRRREAVEMLERSLELGAQQNMRSHQDQVRKTLERLRSQK